MRKNTYFILVMICLSLLLGSCDNNKPPAKMPDDFDFTITFEHAFTVDTYKDILTETDLYIGDVVYEVRFDFPDEQMENIYSEFVQRDIYKIEDGTDVGKIEVIPPVGVFLEYTMNGETISVLCSDNYISSTSSKVKKNFVAFADFIITYVIDSEQYQDAPHIFYAWE